MNFVFQWLKRFCQISFENLQSKIMCWAFSSLSQHKWHREGPWNPFFFNLSSVKIPLWHNNQQNESTFGMVLKVHNPFHTVGSGGTCGCSRRHLYPYATVYSPGAAPQPRASFLPTRRGAILFSRVRRRSRSCISSGGIGGSLHRSQLLPAHNVMSHSETQPALSSHDRSACREL